MPYCGGLGMAECSGDWMMTNRDTLSAALRTLNNAAHTALRASLKMKQHPNYELTANLVRMATATDQMVDDDA